MLVLFETPAGFAIFKLLDEKKLQKSENLYQDFASVESAKKVIKLKSFEKFEDTSKALASAASLIEGKMSKDLKKFLKGVFAKDAHEKLAVADAKLGQAIKSKLEIDCVADSSVSELMRCIRSQLSNIMPSVDDNDLKIMSLGLGHSLSRYKLKFSPDKIDTMIVQAVSLLDDLDKELNNYMMRAREWYGWHFPELGKIITDNIAYIRSIQMMGTRDNCKNVDFSDVLPEEIETRVKEGAEISMGTEISDLDMLNIRHLCDQVLEIQEYRGQLYEYLKNRMFAIAPNLTAVVGELIGARLISHAGSLLNLAKHPASTVQILGAEKALFKALKTKHDTPKYGIIYHAQVVGQASAPLKGKASRMLAAKAALACRADALFESLEANNKKVELDAEFLANRERIEKGELGMKGRSRVESRLKMLEGGNDYQVSGTGKAQAKFDKYEAKSEIQEYKTAADNTMKVSKKRKFSENEAAEEEVVKIKAEDQTEADEEPKKKKKKKKDKQKDAEVEEQENNGDAETPKKKKSKMNGDVEESPAMNGDTESAKKKKKKKKAKEVSEDD
eukprot:05258.XXX_195403_197269_1 [CDS] Oithona nana genome sequencing.